MGGEPDLYGVIGHPVAHSRSPLIHRLFAEQTGQHLTYVLVDAPPGKFLDVLAQFRTRGGCGLNVTLPYKGDAFRFASQRTARSELAQAVNTLCWTDDGVLGDNTDGAGLLADLTANLGLELADSRVLLLGAGGAARGALGPLLEASPSQLVIANRTVAKAEELAVRFSPMGPVKGCGFEDLRGAFDLIVNSTSASIAGEVPPLPAESVTSQSVCYDMMYERGPTCFLRWARENGASMIADGTGMLVEQAAESFLLWRGVRPETGHALSEVRRQLR